MLDAPDLRAECQAACARLHQDNAQSVNVFLETLAALCEKEHDMFQVATAIRGTERPANSLPLSPSSLLQQEGNGRDSWLSSPPSPHISKTDEATASDMMTENVSLFTKGTGKTPIGNVLVSKSFIAHSDDILALPFMNADGTVHSEPSHFQHIFGPKLKQRKDKLVKRACFCKPMTGCLPNFVESQAFKLMSAAVICLNFFFIILQSDYRMNYLDQEDTTLMTVCGYGFTAFYTIEIGLILVCLGRDFFLGPDMAWNVFDLVIVLVAWAETVIKLSGMATVNTSFLRILRFFKISRVLRMFTAVRMFKEIRIMVDSLSGCFSIFLFCSIILAIFLSIFAIFFVQGSTTYMELPNAEFMDPEIAAGLKKHFGSVSVAMLSLFKAATGGDDWTVFFDLVEKLGPMYIVLFITFIGYYVLAFFNVITAVFCEKAISLAAPTRSELSHQRLEKEYNDAKELSDLIKRHMKHNSHGAEGHEFIRLDHFSKFITEPEVETYFEVRGLKALSAHKFFKTLCRVNDTDQIDVCTLVSACVRLDSVGSTMDMHTQSLRATHYYRLLSSSLKHDVSALKTLHEEQSASCSLLRSSSSDIQDQLAKANGLLENTVALHEKLTVLASPSKTSNDKYSPPGQRVALKLSLPL